MYYMYYVLNREKESKMSAEHIFFLFFKCKALVKTFSPLKVKVKFRFVLLLCFAHLGGERDDSHSAICCFEGRPRGGLNANELNFPQRQIVDC